MITQKEQKKMYAQLQKNEDRRKLYHEVEAEIKTIYNQKLASVGFNTPKYHKIKQERENLLTEAIRRIYND